MANNRDRIKFLEERIKRLNGEIIEKNLEQQYIELQQQIAEGKLRITPVDEEQWDIMLPAEREKNLLSYYHTFRVEQAEMIVELRKRKRTPEKLREWLENPYVKITLTATSFASATVALADFLSTTGLFFKEEDD